jgi:hypothetical protein
VNSLKHAAATRLRGKSSYIWGGFDALMAIAIAATLHRLYGRGAGYCVSDSRIIHLALNLHRYRARHLRSSDDSWNCRFNSDAARGAP